MSNGRKKRRKSPANQEVDEKKETGAINTFELDQLAERDNEGRKKMRKRWRGQRVQVREKFELINFISDPKN